jgi:hypothetical protein
MGSSELLCWKFHNHYKKKFTVKQGYKFIFIIYKKFTVVKLEVHGPIKYNQPKFYFVKNVTRHQENINTVWFRGTGDGKVHMGSVHSVPGAPISQHSFPH